MSEYTPTTDEVREEFVYGHQEVDMRGDVVVSFDEANVRWDRWLAEVERAAAWPVIAERDAAIAVIEKVRALLPGPRTWAESLSRMHDGSMFPQLIDAEKVAAALGLTAGQEGENDELRKIQ